MSYVPIDPKGAVLLLPKEAREALMAASKVVPLSERPAAIDGTVARLKLKFPQCFQPEKETAA